MLKLLLFILFLFYVSANTILFYRRGQLSHFKGIKIEIYLNLNVFFCYMRRSLKSLIHIGIYTAGIYVLAASLNCIGNYFNYKKALEESQKPHYGLELCDKWNACYQEQLSRMKDLTVICNPFSSLRFEHPLELIVSKDLSLELCSTTDTIKELD